MKSRRFNLDNFSMEDNLDGEFLHIDETAIFKCSDCNRVGYGWDMRV